jgi:hypothetical protein
MKHYRLAISESFNRDLERATYYISEVLKNRSAAQTLAQKTKKALSDLQANAYGYPLVRDEKLANQGYRWKAVNNYIIFFIASDDCELIKVFRFLYKRRNWSHILGE